MLLRVQGPPLKLLLLLKRYLMIAQLAACGVPAPIFPLLYQQVSGKPKAIYKYIDFFRDRGKILAKAGYFMKYIFSWRAFIVANCVVVFLSVFPFSSSAGPDFSFADKLAHLFIYAGLSFVGVNTFFLKQKKHPRLISFTHAALLGLLMEGLQYGLAYRSFETGDIFSNCLGAALGCLLRIV